MVDSQIIGSIRPDPFTERLGIRSQITDDGVCVTTLHCGPDECNIFGAIHGALLFAMADVGMGRALTCSLEPGQKVSTVTITSNYIRAGKPGLITAESKVLKSGRTVAHLACEIRDGGGALCTQFSGVFHIDRDRREKHDD